MKQNGVILMKDFAQIVRSLESLKDNLSTEYHVNEISIFGSYSREEAKEDSDLDLLIDFEEKPSLLKFIKLKNFLQETLNIKIDLVMKSAIKPSLYQEIINSAIAI